MFTRERVAQLRGQLAELQDAAVSVVLVSTATPEQARAAGLDSPPELLLDPARDLYRAAGMQRSIWRILHPLGLLHALRALRHGHRQGALQGDALQLGGVVLLDAEGRVTARWRDRQAGQLLPWREILHAVFGG